MSDFLHRTLPLYRAYGPEGAACQDAFLSAIAGSNPTPENLEAFKLYDVSVADPCVKAGDTPCTHCKRSIHPETAWSSVSGAACSWACVIADTAPKVSADIMRSRAAARAPGKLN